jgi:tRNA (guanine37-N1)-methyltransferase
VSAGLTFEVFTLFPAAIESFLAGGLIGKALTQELVAVHCTDYRDFTHDRHRTVDDTPYGGGAGMVIKIEPVVAALEAVTEQRGPMHRILVTPSAPRFDQRAAERLAKLPRIGLLCGRYEGIDDRVRESYVDECLSIGDFVLNGGEVAALTIIEAVARLREGVLGNPDSVVGESFTLADHGPWLEHPHYTRPVAYRGHEVPKVLMSGDHRAIGQWRAEEACRRTWALRPDLRPRQSVGERLACVAILPGQAQDVLGDLLRCLRQKTDLPLAVICKRGAVEGAELVELRARDLKELRRRVRRSRQQAPQVVALVDGRSGPGCVDEPSLLLDLLEIRAGEEGGRPLVLLVSLGEELPQGVDAVFAPLSSSPLQEGLELAQSAQMIESSQPKTATGVATLVAAAIRRLRHPQSP